jgi:hypothetical protein
MKTTSFTPHNVENVLCLDEELIDRDMYYRCQFLKVFLHFTEEDIAFIHEHMDFIRKITPTVVNGVHRKILAFDATRKLMLGRLEGYNGEMFTDPDDIVLESPNVVERARIFCATFIDLLASNWDEAYINGPIAVGLSYKWGNKYIDIPIFSSHGANMRCQTLYVENTLMSDLPNDVKSRLAVALTKALNIFTDLTTMSLLNDYDLPPSVEAEEIQLGSSL